ncbi:MAG: C69 family dipeptidase [Trueperaceae bacterium]|nr:C69 family dipeptidase [Trueperaceae bacterium]
MASSAAYASYGLYVGKNLTENGTVFLGGSGDEVSGHWLEIVPRQTHEPGETIRVGVTEEARYPGEFTEIPQVETTFKYITSNYSDFAGFPPPLTNGGLNEHQVAGRDIWSPSRNELREMTPDPQRGPQYSDLARIAMERATTAREAVEIVGAVIDEHGFSTYGGNSHLFADSNEGWVMIQYAGGQGLWVAERLGPDEVRMSYPAYLNPIPRDHIDFDAMQVEGGEDAQFLASDNFIPFAVEQGWYDPEAGEAFDPQQVYAANATPSSTVQDFEARLRELAPVTLREFMAVVRDPAVSSDTNGYGQVAELRDDLEHAELARLWVAPTGSVTAPFVPWHIGATDVPPEFGKHRYLYRDAGSEFLNAEYQLQEATPFAYRTFKRLMYYTCSDPGRFLPDVTETLESYENGWIEDLVSVEAIATRLLDAGDDDLAGEYLTYYSNTEARNALRMGEALVDGLDARIQAFYDIPRPEGDINAGPSVNCQPGGKVDLARRGPLAEQAAALAERTDDPAVTTTADAYAPGEPIEVLYANGQGNPRDWLGVANVDAPMESFEDWQYVAGPTGYAQFVAPSEPGAYEIRFFWDDGYELGARTTITVEEGDAEGP